MCVKKKDVPVVVKVLKSIEKEVGIITPKTVVEAAASPRSPIHKYFTWDDTKAAALFREDQARKLIASISVTFTDSGGEEQQVRAFVNIKAAADEDVESPQGYISSTRAMKSVDYKTQVIEYAHNQLVQWDKKFGNYKEFFGVHEAIQKITSSRTSPTQIATGS